MQIVIDIPDDIYSAIVKQYRKDKELQTRDNLYKAIVNGTPLPKGHGDLVDFDRLCKEYWDGNYMEIHKDDLSNIKPVIEADGGDAE